MTEIKKVWVEPELLVLVRSRSEEVVLGLCKVITGAGSIANSDNNCMYPAGCSEPCSGLGGS